MNCRDVGEVADSFARRDLSPETDREIRRHLDGCPSCRDEIDARRRLRAALHRAFDRAQALQPRPEFTARLREQLRLAAGQTPGRPLPRRLFALAAGAALAAGLAGVAVVDFSRATVDALARDARGDHWNCALKNRRVRTPVPLDEAARRFDGVYRLLLTAPPDDVSTPNGLVHVVDRHSCAYGSRRFGHVVLEYHGRVVSLFLTGNDDAASGSGGPAELTPRLDGSVVNGLSVVSVRGLRHTILLVGDLDARELTQLSEAVSIPLARQVSDRLTLEDRRALAPQSTCEAT